MNADVIIIGAGISGLATGALLTKAGYSVLIIEKSNKIGGRAFCFEKDGFILDNGIHLSRFALKGKCAEVLRRVGLNPQFRRFKKILIFQNDKLFPFPKGPISYFKSSLLSRKTKIESLKYLFTVWFQKPSDYENRSVLESLSPHEPEENFLDLTKIFLASSLACPSLEKASTEEVRRFFLHGMKSPLFPVGYLRGGWKRAIDFLEKKVLENGEILKGLKVEEIVIKDDLVNFVSTSRGKFIAKYYILTVPAQDLHLVMDINKLSPEITNYVKNVENNCGFTIYMALNREFSELMSNIRIGKRYKLFGTMILTAKPSSMGTIISTIEPKVAPKGKHLLVWFCFVPVEKIKNKNFVNSLIEEVKCIIRNSLRICLKNEKFDVSDYCEWEKIIVHKMVDGAIPKVGQRIHERLDFRCNIENLFFAGDTTRGDGWGGDIAFDSALQCSKLIDKIEKSKSI